MREHIPKKENNYSIVMRMSTGQVIESLTGILMENVLHAIIEKKAIIRNP